MDDEEGDGSESDSEEDDVHEESTSIDERASDQSTLGPLTLFPKQKHCFISKSSDANKKSPGSFFARKFHSFKNHFHQDRKKRQPNACRKKKKGLNSKG